MNHARTWVMALVTSSVISILAPAARAQASAETAGAPRVEIVLVGHAASRSLAERIRSWFGAGAPLRITNESVLAAERVLGPHSAGVAVWVTLRAPGSARIYFAVAGEADEPTRYLVREVPLDAGLDEIGSERVAQVVHSSVTALIDDSIDVVARPEIERELAPPPAPDDSGQSPPAPAPEPPAPVASETTTIPEFTALAGIFYRGALSDDEGFAHGPGLALGGAFDLGQFGVGAVARGHYALPHAENFEELEVTLSELSGRVGARAFAEFGAFELDLELGGGAAWVRYDPEGSESGPLPAPRDTDQRFFWFGSGGLRHELGPLELGVRLELELYPALSHYELESGRELAVSSRYRPALVLELVLD